MNNKEEITSADTAAGGSRAPVALETKRAGGRGGAARAGETANFYDRGEDVNSNLNNLNALGDSTGDRHPAPSPNDNEIFSAKAQKSTRSCSFAAPSERLSLLSSTTSSYSSSSRANLVEVDGSSEAAFKQKRSASAGNTPQLSKTVNIVDSVKAREVRPVLSRARLSSPFFSHGTGQGS